ncbi:hypothetical protein AQUCO_03500031v1 [Aquilegia coerulea]|uniref:G-patch domain-containing protein n=1 Tax=Aquilegia coerulea TaxID=218851 RepID=A0A2G5CVR4_AQUCA|nr:hypothetical protein AQUCO_03500031v1 [Aquilegia coerulea]PIA35358.1 hypothetical protein AQUCO_03500031v1 [Aquilegia coerulea]
MGDEVSESNSIAINSSNKGFQLLKKCGWTEGTGLGASQQGRLQPLQTHVKNNKRGLGAEKIKAKTLKLPQESSSISQNNNERTQSSKKAKALSKRLRKMQEEEE